MLIEFSTDLIGASAKPSRLGRLPNSAQTILVSASFVGDCAKSVSERLAIGIIVRCPEGEGGEGGDQDEKSDSRTAGFFLLLRF